MKAHLIILAMLMSLCVLPQDTFDLNDIEGDWRAVSTWNQDAIPTKDDSIVITTNNGGTINVPTVDDDSCLYFESKVNLTLNVNGNLVVLDDYVADNNMELNISGSLIILGDIQLKNNAQLTVTGNILLNGNFYNGSGANLELNGDMTINGVFSNLNSLTITGSGNINGLPIEDYLGTLPVEFISFSGIWKDNTVILNWSTSSEQNNHYFEIQKSFNGSQFYKIGITYGAGNSNYLTNYSFKDEYIKNSILYYRLEQIDYNGEKTLSKIITVKNKQSSPISVFPIPLKAGMKINLHSNLEVIKGYFITDTRGKILYEKMLNTTDQNRSNLQIDLKLETGIYWLSIIGDYDITSKKIVVH